MPGRIVGETIDGEGRTRLRADAPGARAAHPPREGDLEHLHEPDADGGRRDGLPGVARSGGLRELGGQCAAKAAYACERLCDAARRRARVPRGGVLQGVRAPAVATGGRGLRRGWWTRGFLAGVPAAVGRARRPARGRDRAAHARGDRRVRGRRSRRCWRERPRRARSVARDRPAAGTLKEISRPGRRASSLPALDVPAAEIPAAHRPDAATDLPGGRRSSTWSATTRACRRELRGRHRASIRSAPAR